MAQETETPIPFPNTRFPFVSQNPGDDSALVDNLGLVLERIDGLATAIQHINNSGDRRAVEILAIMIDHEVGDGHALLDSWHAAKHSAKGDPAP